MFVAGVSAILSALVYSEFAVQFPYAGGAFNYCAVTLGELPAWLVVCMLVLSYVLANAAIARSFSAYFAQLVGQDPAFFTFAYKDYTVDFMAAALVIVVGVLLMFTTGGGSIFNLVITISQLVVIAIILVAGFTKANPANLTPFLPYGTRGMFDGAAFCFFSFIGCVFVLVCCCVLLFCCLCLYVCK